MENTQWPKLPETQNTFLIQFKRCLNTATQEQRKPFSNLKYFIKLQTFSWKLKILNYLPDVHLRSNFNWNTLFESSLMNLELCFPRITSSIPRGYKTNQSLQQSCCILSWWYLDPRAGHFLCPLFRLKVAAAAAAFSWLVC